MTPPSIHPLSVVDYRPWGSFERFTLNQPTTVKIITIDPGMRLSLQFHEHRSEFWYIIDGPVKVTSGAMRYTARTGDRVFIPSGVQHRIENEGESPCRILEIAFGNFDESDIVRLADDYDRVTKE